MRIALLLACLVLFASSASAQERSGRWGEDLDVARDAWLAKDRSFSPTARAEALRLLAALKVAVLELRDYEIVAELARIAALSQNAHTRAYVLRNRGYWRRYPIRIWRFADGWRVIAAQGNGSALLGRKITAIDGKPVETAQAAVRPLYAGNDRWSDYMASYTLTSPEALLASGVTSGEATTFVVDDERGRSSVRLEPMVFQPRNVPEESWWFLSPAHPATTGWQHVLAGKVLPPVLNGAAVNYRVASCAGDVLYFQFNRAQDGEGETLLAFGERLAQQLRSRTPRSMIVDLRFNTGGDATLGHQFFKVLTTMPWTRERGRLVVIVGPNTFSAGITHAVWLKQEAAATFVGTEPGDELDTWAEGGNVDLPHSQLRLHYADMAHRYSKRPIDIPKEFVFVDWNVDNLRPDVAADWTWASYVAGRDPYVEALGGPIACPS
jgi:hypothetical protein